MADALHSLAGLYRKQGNLANAEPLYRRALSIAEKTQGPEHPSVGTALNDLAEIYRGLGRAAEAEALLKRSVDIREKARAAQLSGGSGTEDPAYMLSQANELYRAGKYAEAIP